MRSWIECDDVHFPHISNCALLSNRSEAKLPQFVVDPSAAISWLIIMYTIYGVLYIYFVPIWLISSSFSAACSFLIFSTSVAFLSKTAGMFSRNFVFHRLISCGLTLYFVAISFNVLSSLSTSRTILAFSSGLQVVRC